MVTRREAPDAEVQQVGVLKSGDFFGERALLTDEERAATITVSSAFELFAVPLLAIVSLYLREALHVGEATATGRKFHLASSRGTATITVSSALELCRACPTRGRGCNKTPTDRTQFFGWRGGCLCVELTCLRIAICWFADCVRSCVQARLLGWRKNRGNPTGRTQFFGLRGGERRGYHSIACLYFFECVETPACPKLRSVGSLVLVVLSQRFKIDKMLFGGIILDMTCPFFLQCVEMPSSLAWVGRREGCFISNALMDKIIWGHHGDYNPHVFHRVR